MHWNIVKQSFLHIIKSSRARRVWFFTTWIFLLLWWWMTDFALASGNLWNNVAILHIVLYVLFCFLFGLFVATVVYKIYYFGDHNKKHTALWGVGWFLGILVAGCPACALSLASYVWLASVVSLLPRHWLELKIAGILLLLWVLWKQLVTLEVCEVKLRK